MANKYTNTASKATLVDPVSSSATSITVSAFTGWPGATPYWAEIARGTASAEVVKVTAVAGTTLTVSRGQDGTVAAEHNAGDLFEHVIPAYLPNLAEQHAEATTAHGTASAVVGQDDTGTLTAKTYRGMHTHVFTDADPASGSAAFEVTADDTKLRDGFVHNNSAADPDRAAFRATQVGADRFVAYNDGTVKIAPSGTATRPGLENDGTTQLDGATTINDTATVKRIDIPVPEVGDAVTRVKVRTQTGQDALEVIDGAAVTRTRIDEDGALRIYFDNGVEAIGVDTEKGILVSQVGGASATALLDGELIVGFGDPTAAAADARVKVGTDHVELTSSLVNTARIDVLAGGAIRLQPASGPKFYVTDLGVEVEDPSTPGSIETWHGVGALYQNGWSNFFSGWNPVRYRKTANNRVEFKGAMQGGTLTAGTVVFNLPAAYRPAGDSGCPVANLTNTAAEEPSIRIRSSGDVQIYGMQSTTNGSCALDGCSFSLD